MSLRLSVLIIADQIGSLSQPLNDELVALSPAVDVLHVICGGLEVAGGVVALGDEDVVINATFQRLIEGNRGTLK